MSLPREAIWDRDLPPPFPLGRITFGDDAVRLSG